MNIHYGPAVKKFFRNVPFKFMTSITMDEVFSLQDVYKYGKYKFLNFAKYFQQMMFTDKWVFEIDKWNKKLLPYKTDEPFRLGLALEGNYVHFFMYLQDSCAVCDPKFDKKKAVDLMQIFEIYSQKYGVERARAEIQRYAYHQHGIKCIDNAKLAIQRGLAQLDHANHIDWKKGIDQINSTTKKKRARQYHKKGDIESTVKAVEEASKEKAELGQDNPGTNPAEAAQEMSKELEQDLEQGQKEIETEQAKFARETKDEYHDLQDQNSMPVGFKGSEDSMDGNFEQY
jgi:hypothetical protein